MVEINLLPWRIQQYHYERTILLRYLLAGLVMALLIVSIFHVWLTIKNESQAERVEVLRLRLPDESINAANEGDEGNQDYFSAAAVLKLFDATASDKSVCYTQFMREQGKLTLTGSAKSLISVTHALRSLGASDVLNHLQLSEIKRQGNHDSLQFTVDAREV